MPRLVKNRWYPNDNGRTDFGFFIGLYDPVVQAVMAYMYEQHLLFRIWAPDWGFKLVMANAGEANPDDRLEQISQVLGWLKLTVELPIVGETDGRVFATTDAIAYFAYRDGGGVNNPAGYCGRNLWRRGGAC